MSDATAAHQEPSCDLVYLWQNIGEGVRDLLDEGFRPDDVRATVEQALLLGMRNG